MKQTRSWIRRCTGVLMAGLAVSSFGLAGSAQAAPLPAPSGHWCPGQPWNPAWGTITDWDWNRCHDWQGVGAPLGPAGSGPWGPPPAWAPQPAPPPPPWAPGATMMWNPTVGNWGIWNNGIWTPV